MADRSHGDVTCVPLLERHAWLAWGQALVGARSVAGGACDTEPGRARARAAGELLERVVLVEASLSGEGVRASVPQGARRHALADLAGIGTPTDRWVAGSGVSSGATVWVPAQAVLFDYRDTGREARCVQTTVGVAADADGRVACARALAEVLERDTVGRLAGGDGTGVRLGGFPSTAGGLLAALARAGLGAHAFVVRRAWLHVAVVAIANRRQPPFVTFGAAARADAGAAVSHALTEAVAVRAALANRDAAHDTSQGAFAVAARSVRHAPAFLERLRRAAAHAPAAADLAGRAPDGAGRSAPGSPWTARQPAVDDWARLCTALLGDEPVVVRLGVRGGAEVVRAVCPGALTLRPWTTVEDLARSMPIG